MPYIIALVIIIVAAGALLLFRQPAEAPIAIQEVPTVTSDETDNQNPPANNGTNIPEGFTPPTTPPPSSNPAIEEQAVSPTIQSFAVDASYFTPNRTKHDMVVSFELDGTTIVDANVTYDGATAQTPNHKNFDEAYPALVIGQDITTLQLSRVGGASLTSTAFNEAIAEVRAQI